MPALALVPTLFPAGPIAYRHVQRVRPAMEEDILRRRADAAGGEGGDARILADLLRRVASGDRAAFRLLYDRAAPRLFGVALRIVGERGLAADALQDAFIQVLNQSGRFDPARGSAEAWLVSLVRYRALDIVRGRRREVLGFEPEDAPLEEPDALARLSADEDGVALRACLEALEADRRRLIALAFLEGLSQAELAARFHLPLGTVKSSIRRGLLKLRECLGR
jgi:RNA polymerase sigma-70 factor, ECF subfamily